MADIQEYTLYPGYMEKMFNQECINSFDDLSNYVYSEPMPTMNITTTEEKGPNSHMYCYDHSSTQIMDDSQMAYMNSYDYVDGESNSTDMTHQVLYDYSTYDSSAPSSPDSSLTFTSPHYSPHPSPNEMDLSPSMNVSPHPSPNEMDLSPSINMSPHDVNHHTSFPDEKVDQPLTDGNNAIHSLENNPNTIHHHGNGIHSHDSGTTIVHTHSHMDDGLIHNQSLSDENLIQSHQLSQFHFPQQSIESHQLVDNQQSMIDSSSENSHGNQNMKHGPCLLLSHFKQEKLEKILDQEKQRLEKEGQARTSDNMKPSQQYLIAPNISMNENGSRKVLPNHTYFTDNQGIGHVAITTIGNNIQGSNAFIIQPVQTMYPISTTHLSNFFVNPYVSTEFKCFDGIESKKRGRLSCSSEKERRVRPKVVPEKGAIQCKGFNRKKKTQCKNAALMEYVGPRPLYCAEHIDLDTKCLYTKCKSPFNKTKDDEKGCREVVLKEFKYCHKHYFLSIEEMMSDPENRGRIEAQTKLERAKELLKNLETEAMKAKRTDPDLFQRKHKLIPKFQQIIRTLNKYLHVPKALTTNSSSKASTQS